LTLTKAQFLSPFGYHILTLPDYIQQKQRDKQPKTFRGPTLFLGLQQVLEFWNVWGILNPTIHENLYNLRIKPLRIKYVRCVIGVIQECALNVENPFFNHLSIVFSLPAFHVDKRCCHELFIVGEKGFSGRIVHPYAPFFFRCNVGQFNSVFIDQI